MASQAYARLLERAKIYIPSGASFTGDVTERIRSLMTLIDEDMSLTNLSVLPGDYVRVGSDESPGISLAAPIGYDVWYLFLTDNSILPFETWQDDKRTIEILERLEPFLSQLQGIEPLRSLRNRADLERNLDVYAMNWYFENAAPRIIKEMRYETILNGNTFKYSSPGMQSNSVGYLAFPVGQLGVMEILSVIGESMTESDSFSISAEEAIVEGKEMMPPVHNNRGYCIGTHLVEGGYLVQGKTEYLADDFAGQASIEPHRWLRYWIDENDTWPMPGEFIALLAKPELYHVWWFQPTYPFLYSGNFFETEYYTSGIVQEVIAPAGDELTNVYRVWIRGYEIYLRSSDFYEFEVGDRVPVIKKIVELNNNFDWTLLEDGKNNDSSSATSPDEDWVIAPISFYL